MEEKIACGCHGTASGQPCGEASKKEKENWYLPYMDKKTKGMAVEERESPVAVFYCAGASNVGQSTMLASVRAANHLGYDKASLLCLASISAGLPNITNAAKQAKGIVVIDGCPMSCAMKTMNKAGFTLDKHLIVSKDLNISKNFDLNSETDIHRIAEALEKAIVEVYQK
ncbi:putative zinc-binding protein [Desulfatirhabdium butyrativorans]|uniref:putative zinc-binding protein n=1 Tax=Desulfatirhabdium butyrativorans TaxID=340467 RepID=UPI0004045FD8|nr:putative zinc-binding protein [Desulfatirhabdium butyrativorans]